MEKEEMNFDENVPVEENVAEASPAPQNQEKSSLKDMANNCNLVNYEFVKSLKQAGHSSIADLIFKESMTMCSACNMSSEAIGKNRFFEFLETGYYSSGRLLMYLDFSKSIGVGENIREALVDSVTGIHKILAASIRTVRANAAKNQKEQQAQRMTY